jgi:hypothetical protein
MPESLDFSAINPRELSDTMARLDTPDAWDDIEFNPFGNSSKSLQSTTLSNALILVFFFGPGKLGILRESARTALLREKPAKQQ